MASYHADAPSVYASDGTVGRHAPTQFEYSCRRIDETLSAVEHCTLSINVTAGVIHLSGSSTLRSTVIDDIDALCYFDQPSSMSRNAAGRTIPNAPRHEDSNDTENAVVICVPPTSDYALLLPDRASVEGVVTQIQAMKAHRWRTTGNKSLAKMILYALPSLDALVLPGGENGPDAAASVTGGQHWTDPMWDPKLTAQAPSSVRSYIRWRPEYPAVTIPFPHSRLDFLQFRFNRSVMYKLTAGGDLMIELSCDNVGVVGTMLPTNDVPGGGRVGPNGSGAVLPQETPRWLKSCKEAMTMDNVDALAALVSSSPPSQSSRALGIVPGIPAASLLLEGHVVILTDRSLYVAEKSGKVLVQLLLEALTHIVLVTHDAAPHPGSAPARLTAPWLFLLCANGNCTADGTYEDPSQRTTGGDLVVVRSKFCVDLLSRLQKQHNISSLLKLATYTGASARQPSAGSRSVSPQMGGLGRPVTGLEALAEKGASRAGSVVSEQRLEPAGEGEGAQYWQRMPPPGSFQPVGPMVVACAVQTDDVPLQISNAAAANPAVVAANAAATESAPDVFLLRNCIAELRDEVAHRDMTISVLRQRCDQLAAQLSIAPVTTGSQPASQNGGKSGPSTPRNTTGANKDAGGTPRRVSTTLKATGRGAAQQAAAVKATSTSVVTTGDGNTVALLASQIETLRFYVALLEEENARLIGSEWKERCELMEREFTDASMSLELKLHGGAGRSPGDGAPTEAEPAAPAPNRKSTGRQLSPARAGSQKATSVQPTGRSEEPTTTNEADSNPMLVAQLRYALSESQRSLRQSQQQVMKLKQEMVAVTQATDAHLGQLSAEVKKSVEAFFEDQRRKIQQCMALPHSIEEQWKQLIERQLSHDLEAKVQEECRVRTAELTEASMVLVQELRLREKNLDTLHDEVLQYFALDTQQQQEQRVRGGSAGSLQSDSNNQQHQLQRNADINAFFRDAINQLSALMRSGDLLSERQGTVNALEGKIRSLMRQIEDLKRAKDAIVEEGAEASRTVSRWVALGFGFAPGPSVTAGPSAATSISPEHIKELCQELEHLRAQVTLFQSFSHVPLCVSRMTALDVMVSELESNKLRKRQLEDHVERLEQQHQRMSTEYHQFRDDNTKMKKLLDAAQESLQTEQGKNEKLEMQLTQLRSAHAAEMSKLKLEVKDQRSRLHDVIQVNKQRTRSPTLTVGLGAAGGASRPGMSYVGKAVVKPTTAPTPPAVMNSVNGSTVGDDAALFTPRSPMKPIETPSTAPGFPQRESRMGIVEDAMATILRDRPDWPEATDATSLDQPKYSQRDVEAIFQQVSQQRETFNSCLQRAMTDFQTLSTAAGGTSASGGSAPSIPPLNRGLSLEGVSPQPTPPVHPTVGAAIISSSTSLRNSIPTDDEEQRAARNAHTKKATAESRSRPPAFSTSPAPQTPTAKAKAPSQNRTAATVEKGPAVGPNVLASAASPPPRQVSGHRQPSIHIQVSPVAQAATAAPPANGITNTTKNLVAAAQRDLASMTERVQRLEAERQRAEAEERAVKRATEAALQKASIPANIATSSGNERGNRPAAQAAPIRSGSPAPAHPAADRSYASSFGVVEVPQPRFVSQQRQPFGGGIPSARPAPSQWDPPAADDDPNDPIVQAKLRYSALRSKLLKEGTA